MSLKELEIIEEHILIRDTCGYDVIAQANVCDIPQILHFLRICNNYVKLQRIDEQKRGEKEKSL